MNTQLTQITKCRIGIKIILTLSLLFNFIIIAGVGFVFIKFKPVIDTFVSPADTTISQEDFIRSIGVDPEKIPTNAGEITPELANCFTAAVGEDRANEIEVGATPTTLEIMKASNCLK